MGKKEKKSKKSKKEKKPKKKKKTKDEDDLEEDEKIEEAEKVKEVSTAEESKKPTDLKPVDALKIIQALAKRKSQNMKDSAKNEPKFYSMFRERTRYQKDTGSYNRDRGRRRSRRSRSHSRGRYRRRSHSRGRYRRRSYSRGRSRSRSRNRGRSRSRSWDRRRRSRSHERRHSRDRHRERYDRDRHSRSTADTRPQRVSTADSAPADRTSSKADATQEPQARSLLSSIHNNRAATAELKGDKQQESVIYSASHTKKGRGSAKDGGEFLKINRPYKCLVCELRFCVSLQVAEHMRTAHDKMVQPWQIRPSKE